MATREEEGWPPGCEDRPEMTSEPQEQKMAPVKPLFIEKEMKEAYLNYAMSVIYSRALPDVRE